MRLQVREDLCVLQLALKVYHTEHGEYAESLDALAPDLLEEIPVDRFTGEALVYRRTDEGYSLYSVGRNREDDGGLYGTDPETFRDRDDVGILVGESDR